MTRVDAHVYPELRQLCGVYLNQEFATRYGTVARALTAYRAETAPARRATARIEIDRLTAAPGSIMRLHDDFATLGCDVALKNAGEAWNLAALIRRAVSESEDETRSAPET